MGTYLKIIHRAGASSLLLMALLLKVAGVVLLFWKTSRYNGFRKFLDSRKARNSPDFC
jgi:hypothetical protein